MKKTFASLTAFCLGLLISISIIACADDFGGENQENQTELQTLRETVGELYDKISKLEKGSIIKKATYSYGDYSSSNSFTYDTNGRITHVSNNGDSISISYTDETVLIQGENLGTWRLTTNGYNIAAINQLITSIVLTQQ